VIERRLVGFVAGLTAFLAIEGQAAMVGDEVDILVMSQLVGAGGQGGEDGVGQGDGEVEEDKER
jgi:hypothetical protein